MRRQKRFFIGLLLTAFVMFSCVIAFAQQEGQPAQPTDQILKMLLNEYKVTFFKHRITDIILKNKDIQLEMAKKLAATPENGIGTFEVIVIRDYISSIDALSNTDTSQFFGEKFPLLVKGLFGRMNSIYVQKLEDLTEKVSTLTTISLLNNDTQTLNELSAYFKKQTGIAGASFAALADSINRSVKFQINSNQNLSTSYVKEFIKGLDGFALTFKRTSLQSFDEKNILKMKNYTYQKIWKIISAAILQEVADIPSEVERIGKIDINKASEADLLKIPGMSKETAAKIMTFRSERGGIITSIHELDAIKGIGPKAIRKLKTALFAKDFTLPEKEWTVMCFINGDNNLELASLLGVNVMERVGSTANMNIVVQLDRIGLEHIGESGLEASTLLDGNWTTSRRYFVQKDNRPFELNSILLEKMGEADMGSSKNFVEFCKYTISHFPAKHYVVLISNHGSEFGVGGISFDDQSGNHMNTMQVGQALSEVRDAIKEQNGNDRIDLMVFDCCLLAKVEVLKEISEYVHGVYACENVQINWYAYDKFLKALTSKPELSGNKLAGIYLKTYVDYMRNWTRQTGNSDKMVLTSSAFDLTKFKNFDAAFTTFSAQLNAFSDSNPEAVDLVLKAMKPLNDVSVFDLIDFTKKIKAEAKDNKDMRNACDDLLKAYGSALKRVNYKEFNMSEFPESSFVVAEAHNYLEETGNGLSIGIFTKPTWLTIAAVQPSWNLDEAGVMNFLNRFKAGNYLDLKLSQETEWDEFLTKMINKN